MIKYATDIQRRFQRIDTLLSRYADKLHGKIPIVLAGGAAIMLIHAGKRWTLDIDIVQTGQIKGIAKLIEAAGGAHIVSDSIVHLHPDWQSRLVRVEGFGHIELFALSSLDIAVAKTARGSKKDFYDLYTSDITHAINPDEFEQRYREAVKYWIGNEKAFFANMQASLEIIREKQVLNRHRVIEKAVQTLQAIAVQGLLHDNVDVAAIHFLLSDEPEHAGERTPDTVKATALYLLDNAGESLGDSAEEILLADILRRHFKLTEISKDIHRDQLGDVPVNPGPLLKLFKILSAETFHALRPDEQSDIDSTFSGPAR